MKIALLIIGMDPDDEKTYGIAAIKIATSGVFFIRIYYCQYQTVHHRQQ
jgi:hypothetical protein